MKQTKKTKKTINRRIRHRRRRTGVNPQMIYYEICDLARSSKTVAEFRNRVRLFVESDSIWEWITAAHENRKAEEHIRSRLGIAVKGL